MYEEELLKINTHKELITNSLLRQGSYPNKKYVNSLLTEIDTRLAILDYIKVQSGDTLDVEKLNNDLQRVKKDFEILYAIVNEIARTKYIELESKINAYLLSLEENVKRAEKETEFQLETTSLGGNTIYFTDQMPIHTKSNTTVTLELGNIFCNVKSKLMCYIYGAGFRQEDVSFQIGDSTVSPYIVNREYIKVDGDLTTHIYNVNIDNDINISSSYVLLESGANTKYNYNVYGGKNNITALGLNGKILIPYTQEVEIWSNDLNTDFSFFITNGTYINFDFSATPITQNFEGYEIIGLEKDNFKKISFTMPIGSCFKFKTDCTVYAEQESVSVTDEKLYLTSIPKARDFTIYEQSSIETKEFQDIKVTIRNVDYEFFYLNSIAIKEVLDYAGGVR